MELFGIGIFEVLLIILIALIVLGPQDTVKAGRNLGRAVRKLFSSEEWRTLLQASKEIRTIPDKLLEETGLDHPEEIFPSEAEIRKEAGLDDLEQNLAAWNADVTAMSKTGQAPSEVQTGQILPPRQAPTSTASPLDTGVQATRPENLEPELPEMKADLIAAWGNAAVLIPIPQASSAPATQPTVAESEQTPASAEPATPPPDQPVSEPAGQEPDPSTSAEQKQK
jgi:Sec-independent protein translocase protein TatA